MASSKDIDPAIQQLTEASVNMAVGSIDYAINAKAIAMQAAEVTDRLREVLAKGYRLKVIEPITGFGSSLLDFRLQFRFKAITSSMSAPRTSSWL